MLTTGVEDIRISVAKATAPEHKSKYGQYFTPASIAQFMARMFTPTNGQACRLLDAGAGIGSLSAAFLEHWAVAEPAQGNFSVDAFEVDSRLSSHLEETLGAFSSRGASIVIRCEDFIKTAVESLRGDLFSDPLPRYTHAILNPPYKKIRSDSFHRLALRGVGIETVNLYTAFIALSLALLEEGGQLVAIVPRSFCNGPYYRPFREFVLERAAIQHIHLFASRNRAFKDDGVLQENVIIKLQRGIRQGKVIVSVSDDGDLDWVDERKYAFEQIVLPGDPERFIHIPTLRPGESLAMPRSVECSLDDLGVTVSTGPVVDFRLKAHLRKSPEADTVPLIYPGHLTAWNTTWPRDDLKKPNALARNAETEKWLYPTGYYCVVRRFSSKEEKRRIVASVIRPTDFPGQEVLGFENHLNVFHQDRHGLSESLAYGLTVYLNTTVVDEMFRVFNGHTQVNATDLRSMKYPSQEVLAALGEWAMKSRVHDQDVLDEQLERLGA